MEFFIGSDMLKKVLNIVARAVSEPTANPALSGVKITAADNCIVVTGGDGDITIVREIPLGNDYTSGRIIEPGTLLVPSKYFHELIKKLPNSTRINVRKNNRHIKITAGEIETTLSVMDEEDYPSLPGISEENGVTMKGSLLIEMIRETQFAAAKVNSRAVLTGVNWLFSKNSLTMIATNSQRMALRKTVLNSTVTGSFILPVKALGELVNSIDKHQFISIYPNENSMAFRGKDILFYTRLISGNYPDVSRIIPEESVTELVVSRSLLLQGVDRANLLASQWKHNNVTLSLTEDGKMQIASNITEVGQITERIKLQDIKGDKELQISLDGKFLAETLKSINEEMVSLTFGGNLRPVIITPYNKKSTLHLISPVRAS
ncbi:DNA polymerase III subunit beta [Bacillus sp. AK031]